VRRLYQPDTLPTGLAARPFDSDKALHRWLVELAAAAEAVAGGVELPPIAPFQAARRLIRQELINAGIASALDETVAQFLFSTAGA
jgi:hypothetical protein